jgi:uncharacterized peroxidase-related enzyme
MSRLSIVDPSQAAGEVRSTLAAVNAQLGVTPNLFRVAANSGATLSALVQLTGALGKGQLDARVREAIALSVAQVNGCDYCLSAHTFLGKASGLADEDIVAARSGAARDPRTDAILHLATEIVRSRGRIGSDALARAKNAGVSDGEITEIVGNVALNVFTNYLNIVADTEIDFPVVRAAALVQV